MSFSLQRILGFKESLALIIGSVIGSGIFMKPALMAGQIQSAWILILVWVIAGFITLCGALTNAESAAMFPETGGQYIIFQKTYGKPFSFLYGWSTFSVINTAGNASIAYVCSQYLNYFIQLPQLSSDLILQFKFHIYGIGDISILDNLYLKVLTMALLFLFTYINIRSFESSALIQNILSSLKIIAILCIVIGAVPFLNPNITNLSYHQSDFDLNTFMMAITAAFWAYDGWNNLGFVGGEVINPQRNIPRAYIIGLIICITAYALINTAFVIIMGIPSMSNSTFIASDAGQVIWPAYGAVIVTLLVVLSTIGTVNANVLSTSRVSYSWFRDNHYFPSLNNLHPRFNTPSFALNANLLWSCILILSGSFDMLTDMLIFVTWFFYGMSALGVIILRFKMPDFPRDYKVWMYPLPPIIFLLFTFSYLIITIYNDIQNYLNGKTEIIQSLLGLLICLLALPIYFFHNSSNQSHGKKLD